MKHMYFTAAFFAFLLTAPLAHAASPSPAPASATPSAELRRIIRERIEQTLQENTEEKRLLGTLGTVQKVGGQTFTILDTLGRERTVQLTADAKITQGTQAVALKDMSINSGAAIVGKMIDDIIIEARRVFLVDNTWSERRQVSVGTITTWKTTELSLSIRGTDQTATWNVSRKPRFEDSLGNTITAKDITADQAALVVTQEDDLGVRTVTRIHLLAPVQSPQPKTTPSPLPKTSPSPSPKASPKVTPAATPKP